MSDRRLEIIEGDCVEVMASMEADSVDAICTDPPYGIGFMGKEFDTFKPEKLAVQTRNHKPIDHKKQSGRAASMHAGQYDLSLSANRVFQEWTRLWAVAALRVLKPGGWAAVFGGTRTYHRMICGLEDAGFEIRDCVAWLYGSGFPKSLDISAAIDAGACRAELEKRLGRSPTREEFKAAWKTFREVVGKKKTRELPSDVPFGEGLIASHADAIAGRRTNSQIEIDITAPATEAAKEWEGWGTALKPAWEPICLARKPLEGTVAENVLRYGTGGLNIGACRIGTEGGGTHCGKRDENGKCRGHENAGRSTSGETFHGPNSEGGRWPANLVLDEEAAAMLDEQQAADYRPRTPGCRPQTADCRLQTVGTPTAYSLQPAASPSRFFYCAKTSAWERNAGLEGMRLWTTEEISGGGGIRSERADAYQARKSPRRNHHPTVKPVSLMRWIVRLIAPTGQAAGRRPQTAGTDSLQPKASSLILDPFAGSGTTGMACAVEQVDFIGIEKEAEYAEIARRRIEYARTHPRAFDVGTVHAKPEKVIAGQRELFT